MGAGRGSGGTPAIAAPTLPRGVFTYLGDCAGLPQGTGVLIDLFAGLPACNQKLEVTSDQR